ncbi:MAG: DNA polymerase III subunit delta [Actinomycetota bacterium]|nr:DNA polymerase III subunit delta [Actinomycetota bacterium]
MTLVTLVDGSDPTLVAVALGRAVAELLGDEDRSLALEDYGGDDVDLAAVADACATPPFLVGRRVVVVRDVGRWNTEEVAPLLSYLDDPLDTTALVLVAGGGQTPPKLAAAAKAKGRVVSTAVDSRQAAAWIEAQVRESGLGLDRAAVNALTEHLGEDASRLLPILEVLQAAFGPGGRVTREDLEPYMGQAGSVTPWAFTDSIDAGNVAMALGHLHRLLEGGARHPLVVLAIIHRHVQSLMRVDSPSIRTEGQAAQAMGMAKGRSTYPAKKALRAAQQWGSDHIADAVGLVAAAEVDLKGQSAWPAEAVLEVLVARLCRLARPRPAELRRGTSPSGSAGQGR